MTIRPARPSDSEALAALARACFGASAWQSADFQPHPLRWALVAETANQVGVGYLVMQWVEDEGEVQSLAVVESERRHGIAGKLLAAAMAEARRRGIEALFLEVRESNQPARRFYLRHGFSQCGRRPGYYHDPEEAAVLMRRELAGQAGPSDQRERLPR